MFDEGQDVSLVEGLYSDGAILVEIPHSCSISITVPDDTVARKVYSRILSIFQHTTIDEVGTTDTVLNFIWDQ